MIEREVAEKARLAGEIKVMREHRRELEERSKVNERKGREL